MQFLKKFLIDKNLWLSIFVIFYIIIDQNPIFLWSLLVIWITNNTVPLIVHEGWSHKYILPRSKLVGYLLDFYAYIITLTGNAHYSGRAHWRKYHIVHHKEWKGSMDHVEWALKNNNHLHLIFGGSGTKQMPNIHSPEIIDLFRIQTYKELDKIEIWMDKHNVLITTLFHFLFCIVFGWEIYFYFLLFPAWSFTIWMKFFTETIAHWKRKERSSERDHPWLFLLIGCNAFHKSHHEKRDEMQLGNGIWKYLHINYWFMKIFYKQQVPLA